MKILNKTIADYAQELAAKHTLKEDHIQNAIELHKEDNTIPFIARYRKEMTGSMDDEQLRMLFADYESLVGLDERRNTILNTLNELGVDDAELEEKIVKASKMTELEDLYRPYKPKKQTRATIAEARGVEPLANTILALSTQEEVEESAQAFLKDQKSVDEKTALLETIEEALGAANDYIAGKLSDNPDIRKILKERLLKYGNIQCQGKTEEDTVYRLYYDHQEPLKKLAGHRLLAINRGEKEDVLKVSMVLEEGFWQIPMETFLGISKKEGYAVEFLKSVCEDAYSRLIKPSIDNEIRNELTELAHEEALKIFALNLKNALSVPPMKSACILALDPGYRNGCKCAVVNGSGHVLDAFIIYPVLFENRIPQAKDRVRKAIKGFKVETVVIGNGTASRETEEFLNDLFQEDHFQVPYLIVDESGASVYSASPISKEELPELELNLRSAVSLARRVLDPLAELVKIDPKSIGVGQYQHDMNQKKLDEILGGVTEGVVNQVGVSLNTASPSLLAYVSGINKTTAKNIVEYRNENGSFKSRKELKKVKRLGEKTFKQCAGFLRIENGENPLDNTFVHPESYGVAQRLIEDLDLSFNSTNDVSEEKLRRFADKNEVGFETLKDIVDSVSMPARDIRDDFPAPKLKSEIKSLEDLQVGEILSGVVRNVTSFGAFVDLGVHHDGLVHISQMSHKFTKDPTQVVSVGDMVEVKIIGIDVEKERISLSMKL